MRTVVSPPRRTVATFDNYAEAQRAVDYLSDQEFPVERVAIVGHGLRYVEQVTGRMTVGTAALQGATQGGLLGAFFGLLVGIFFTTDPNPAFVLLVLYGLVLGALAGALLGAVFHSATGGERDFTSASGMQAERYEVQVDDDVADRATDLLRALEGMQAASNGGGAGAR
jgi:uncharacterized membrane protein